MNYYHSKVRKFGQNCVKGVDPSLNLRFKQLITHEGVKNKKICLYILYIVFSKLSNDVSHYCYK